MVKKCPQRSLSGENKHREGSAGGWQFVLSNMTFPQWWSQGAAATGALSGVCFGVFKVIKVLCQC